MKAIALHVNMLQDVSVLCQPLPGLNAFPLALPYCSLYLDASNTYPPAIRAITTSKYYNHGFYAKAFFFGELRYVLIRVLMHRQSKAFSVLFPDVRLFDFGTNRRVIRTTSRTSVM